MCVVYALGVQDPSSTECRQRAGVRDGPEGGPYTVQETAADFSVFPHTIMPHCCDH